MHLDTVNIETVDHLYSFHVLDIDCVAFVLSSQCVRMECITLFLTQNRE